MYRPGYYLQDDLPALVCMMRTHPFALLVTQGPGLLATHLPLLVTESPAGQLTLTGHMSRANQQWRALQSGDEVLAVFTGPHAYVSPRWYSSEADVPTWNYEAAHAYGTWQVLEQGETLDELLEETVDRFEAPRSCPWHLSQLERPLYNSLKRGVVGFSIRVTRLEGAAKLSQDKCSQDINGVVNGLREDGEHSVANAVRKANGSA